MEYQHKQRGYFWVPTLLLFVVLLVSFDSGDEKMSTAFNIAMFGLLVALFVVVLTFSRLEVSVGNQQVIAAFGFGRPHKSIELADIAAVRRVRNTWLDGWGLRKLSRGWMYNVWGLDAIELDLISGRVFRIGTNDCERLFAALTRHVPGTR